MTHPRALLILGLLLLAALAPVALLGDLRVRTHALLALWAAAHVVYLASVWLIMRSRTEHSALPVIVGIALAIRLFLIPAQPTLSEDVYRYLWDGALVAKGINPYVHVPSDPSLPHQSVDLLRRLNHPDVPTVYPPAAQLFFGATAWVHPSPATLKLALIPVEITLWVALVGMLRRRGLPDGRLLLLAWNPLLMIESYASGHADLLTAASLVLTIALFEAKRLGAAGAVFALAVLTKYTPLLLVLYFLRRRALPLLAAAMLTAALLFLPFWSAGSALWAGLRIYLEQWEFNGSLYPLLRAAIGSDEAVRVTLALGLGAAAVAISSRARSAGAAAVALLTAFLLASPTVFPWYLVPLIALLPLHPSPGLLAFSGLVALSYVPLPRYHALGEWTLPSWIPWVEYGVCAAIAGAAHLARILPGRLPAQARRAAWASESTPT